MIEEFDLSNFLIEYERETYIIKRFRLKEFIRRLKEEIPKLKAEGYYDCCNDEDFFELIDKLAGDKLI